MVLSSEDIGFELLHIFSRLRPDFGYQCTLKQLVVAWADTRLRKNDLEAASAHLIERGLVTTYADGAQDGLRLTEHGVLHARELARHPFRNTLRRWRIRWMLKLMRSKSILGVQRRLSDSALRVPSVGHPTAASPTAQ